jgi:hypothetical protein
MDAKTARIRALNDELRQHLTGGTAVIESSEPLKPAARGQGTRPPGSPM